MPNPIEPLTLYSDSPEATRALGRQIGAAVETGQVIALRGELGAGKTTLAQGIAEGLGIAARVTSPTFTLVAEYEGARGLRLVHVDAYRLGDDPADAVREAATFGLEEILAGAAEDGAGDAPEGSVVLIEWAERVQTLLPSDLLLVELRHNGPDPDARTITFTAHGPRSTRLLRALMQQH
ncbi:MAG TPA: tRNA (adenosine(37)-N6)-threonylcarbamoyltransferase complex ATPase subunit type 1 TsaE [Caldilineaceae bacterium]|nr:tRNA (adenosine(37)-N6)-threonylcarbamoyltransferase complex ATPase subunit type 1 TsaE [Caldilineaceae bacterium]